MVTGILKILKIFIRDNNTVPKFLTVILKTPGVLF